MIAGQTGTAFATSSVVNASSQLKAGKYKVWAPTLTAYMALQIENVSVSSLLTVAVGYPVLGAAAPITLDVPNNGQICAVSSAAATLVFQKE